VSKKLLMVCQSYKSLPTIGFAIGQHVRARDQATFHLIEDDRVSELDVYPIFSDGGSQTWYLCTVCTSWVTRAQATGLITC